MPKNTLSQDLLNAMSFRCIGPPRGGRVVAVAGDPSNPAVFYHGAVAGGVFKTTDAGTTWFNVSDGFFKTSSVGALEVAPSSPNVIYAGMGESTIRTDVSYGDGVYKSTDAGRTWTHMGLANTRHIGRIVIHPTNPDLIYVAALGHAFGPNPERGVYRSSNGGATWDLVLHKSEIAGATDITLDAHNPGILYASIWQTRRGPWYLSSGGEDGGLWRSRDGGDTWTDISRAKGLPQSGLYGKIGVAASPVQPGRVWALVESQVDPGLYRSDDFGENWVLLSDSLDLRRRPWYYMHVVADTQHADTVYVSNLGFHRSTDGGKTFIEIPTPHGDNHALWIDPNDNRRMVQGNDGGACVSFNAGGSFSTIYNQLTAQIYNIDTDNLFPWSVYATQQDNGSIGVPTDAAAGVIPFTRCFEAGTGESGYIVVDPKDPMVGYVGAVGSSAGGLGALQRFSRHTDQVQLVNVWPQIYGGDMALKDFKHRFPWTFPILFSPHDPNTLYTCGERAFRSTDEGHSWTAFSPDLTRNDPAKQTPSGGPITLDSSAAEHYCTIFTFRESPHEPGVFWAGSDDGLVHLSRDGGKSWQNVTPPKLPEWAWIRTVEPSPHDHATCYIAATRYKLDDPAPYLYKTTDYGATWTAITSGIGEGDYTRVIRADPSLPGVLYAGTETGLYVSINDGQNWSRWSSNFPVTPVFDLKVRGTDLVIATHGRSLWLLDDLTPIHQAASHKAIAGQPRLFRPRTTLRILPDLYADWIPSEGRVYGVGTGSTATWIGEKTDLGHLRRKVLDAGEGAPRGAIVYYALPEDLAPDTPISLAFHDGTGNVLREYCPKPAGWDKWDDKQKSVNPGPWISTRSGVNRFLWNLRLEGTVKVPGNKTAPELNEGPLALPGPVTVHLTVGDKVLESQFEVVNDPRVTIPVEVLADQQRLLLKIRDVVSEDYRAVVKLRDVREQVEGWRKRLADKADIVAAADGLLARLAAIEETLILPGEQKDTYHLTQRPRLNEAIASLVPVIGTADARPTEQAEALVEEYTAAIREQVAALESVLGGEIASLNQRIAQASSVAILV